jgi:predicted DNA-binding protein
VARAGCLAWQQQGLGECDVVAEATESYRSEMDVLRLAPGALRPRRQGDHAVQRSLR